MTEVLTIDDYNFGIDDTNMAIRYIQTSGGPVILKDGEIENPIFVGINGGSLSKLSDKEIYSEHKRVFIICMKNGFVESDRLFKIFDPIISLDDLCFVAKQLVLIKTSMNVLRHTYYKKIGCIVSKDILQKMFDGKQTDELDNLEIVIPLFELTDDIARMNISLYDKQFGIENLEDILNLSTYYNGSYKRPIIEQLANHVTELRESQFWSNPKNCEVTMTNIFVGRKFHYDERMDENTKLHILADKQIQKDDKTVEEVINKLTQGKKKTFDYLAFIDKNENHTNDILSALKNSKKRTYYAELDESELKIKKDVVTQLICSINDERELFYVFNSLLVSKTYCHMVLNNKTVLERVKPLFNKYGPVYKILIGYAWLCFIFEEGIMKTKSLKEHRFVFDIDTANKLPVFPFIYEDLAQNPYLSILVDNKILNSNENAVSLYCLKNLDGYGVCTLEQFKWRFNLFTTRSSTKNIFDGIDWTHFAISGSSMTACLQKRSPLFNNIVTDGQSDEDQWLTYFNHYYSESDIDMMCNHRSIFGFAQEVDKAVRQIKKNIVDYVDGDLEINPVKTSAVMLTKYFFDENLDDFNKKYGHKYTQDSIIKMLESKDMTGLGLRHFREYLYTYYYVKHKSQVNEEIRGSSDFVTNQYIEDFLEMAQKGDLTIRYVTYEYTKKTNKPEDSDIYLFINDFRDKDNKVDEDQNFLVMKLSDTIKFKLKSSKMMRSIEIFRAKVSDYFGIVSRFHFPCVRAYYTGDNVFILPTCITAMMTGINIDYKYFAGVRDPIDIINKYRMRGFGVLLSNLEKKHMAFYNNHVRTFGGMFYVEGDTKEKIDSMFGPKELTENIYHPLVYTSGLSEDVYNIAEVKKNVKYIKTMDDLKEYYAKKYNYTIENFPVNMFRFKPITDGGFIAPYNSWIPKAYIDMKSDQILEDVIEPKKSKKVKKGENEIIPNQSNKEKKDEIAPIIEKIRLMWDVVRDAHKLYKYITELMYDAGNDDDADYVNMSHPAELSIAQYERIISTISSDLEKIDVSTIDMIADDKNKWDNLTNMKIESSKISLDEQLWPTNDEYMSCAISKQAKQLCKPTEQFRESMEQLKTNLCKLYPEYKDDKDFFDVNSYENFGRLSHELGFDHLYYVVNKKRHVKISKKHNKTIQKLKNMTAANPEQADSDIVDSN